MGSGIGLLVIGASAAQADRTARSAMMPSHICFRTSASLISMARNRSHLFITRDCIVGPTSGQSHDVCSCKIVDLLRPLAVGHDRSVELGAVGARVGEDG